MYDVLARPYRSGLSKWGVYYATLGELEAPHAGRGRRRIGDLVEKT